MRHAAGQALLRGLALGAVPAALALVVSLVVGGAPLHPRHRDVASTICAGRSHRSLLLAPAALSEEIIVSRGAAGPAGPRHRPGAGCCRDLDAFALAHLFNPNSTALGLVNIALAGVLLGAAFYRPGGIWTACGAHLGWNATLAALRRAGERAAVRDPVDRLPARRAGLAHRGRLRARRRPPRHRHDRARHSPGPSGAIRREESLKHVAVIGAGTMGNGIAQVFAMHGHSGRHDRCLRRGPGPGAGRDPGAVWPAW